MKQSFTCSQMDVFNPPTGPPWLLYVLFAVVLLFDVAPIGCRGFALSPCLVVWFSVRFLVCQLSYWFLRFTLCINFVY